MPDPLEELAEARASGTDPQTDPAPASEPEGEQPEPVHPILERFGGDVNKLAEAYANADSFIGRQGSEMGQRISALEQELAASREFAEQQQYQRAPQESDWPDLSGEQYDMWFEDDKLAASTFVAAKTVESYKAEIQRMLDERLGPVERNLGQNTATQVADGLRRGLGNDVVERNMEMLQREMKADPSLLQGDPASVYKRLRRIVTDAEWERGQGRATQAPRAVEPGPYVEGGSNGRPPTQSEPEVPLEEQIKQALLAEQPDRDPVFGATRRP